MFTRLIEVGRKFSKANEGKLRKALESISELLAQIDVDEAERSFTDRQRALQRALAAATPEAYSWVADVFDADMVYCSGGKYFQCPYTLDDAGNATFGDAAEVLPQTVYNPVGTPVLTAAAIEGDCVPLAETELREATASLKLIAPGWGASGYYSPQTLRAAAPVFRKGTKMFWNHQTAAEEASRPEGDLSKLAAELTEDARWDDNGAKGPGLYARAKVFEQYADAVKDLAPHIGVSIRASGLGRQGEAEGRKGLIVEQLTSAKSVDFVTIPGAGGQVLQLFESAGRKPAANPSQEFDMNEQQVQALIEAAVAPVRTQAAAAETRVVAAEAKVTTLETENARLRESLALQGARGVVEAKLKTITMPEMTRQRLTESLVLRATAKDGALDVAALEALCVSEAQKEMAYLSGATGGMRLSGFGAAPAGEPKTLDEAALAKRMGSLFGLSEAGAAVAAAGRQ